MTTAPIFASDVRRLGGSVTMAEFTGATVRR
jgi:hypothetical protein